MSTDRVSPGDAFRPPSAALWNTLVEMAEAYRRQRLGGKTSVPTGVRPDGVIQIKNSSGVDRAQGEVLGIGSPLFTRAQRPNEFKNNLSLDGILPTAESEGAFAILLEPIRIDKIGRAFAPGIGVAKVKIVDEADRFADIDVDQSTEMLSSGQVGLAQLLWIEPEADREESGVAWCVVRIGGAAVVQLDPCG